MNAIAIEVKNVSKRFKEKGEWFYALRDVSLEIKEGEIFGLLGPNGAGKTTLLNLLIGMLTPDSGKVRILGQDVLRNRDVMDSINFVSGETRFHWILRVSDILNFYARVYGIPRGKRQKRINMLMDFFKIRNIKDRDFDSLSTGERMRLVFAKALLNEPRLLLLDEPTLGLDPSMASKLRKEILRINKKQKTTILLTSHYMHEVEQLCDRIAFINNGEIVDTGSVEKVKLRGFSTYDVEIRVKQIVDRKFLLNNGFRIKGKNISKMLLYDETLSRILSLISKKGFEIIDVKTKKPTLEDYFIKASKEGGTK